jgi:hypothetical protein
MTSKVFEHLPQNDQLSLLYAKGVYIAKRKFKNLSVILFQLDNFYIEIVYEKYRCVIKEIHLTNIMNVLFFYPAAVHFNPSN